MSVILGGTNGITYPDATNTAAADITSRFSPIITDTANVMAVKGKTKFVGSSGIIVNGDLYSTNRARASYTISSDMTDATINLSSFSGYSAGITDITLTISSSARVYATTTGTYALTITGGTTGDTLTIVNNGLIYGKGGGGGVNGGGGGGGPAMNLSFGMSGCTINNTNAAAYIGGGGGGGGGTNQTTLGGGGGAGNGSGGVTAGGGAYANGGNGGNEFPGVGGAGGTATSISHGTVYASGAAGTAGGGGGASASKGSSFTGGAGGSGNAVGSNGTTYACGAGGGGWGASGGSSNYGGGSGGKAVNLNSKTVTWTSGDTTRVYGAVS